jgi:hypothetical protein
MSPIKRLGGPDPDRGTAAEFLLNFGAGVDWKLSSHLGLRLQDRVNLYKSPQMVTDNLYYYDPANLGGT